jgi:hypothetical protein
MFQLGLCCGAATTRTRLMTPVATPGNPMFLASMARAKALTARKEALATPLVVTG